MKSEILAPVGKIETLLSALNCGADAVYLGAGDFNARQNAQNFTFSELEEAVKLCHKRGVKVYLTLNTLISDSEIERVKEVIKRVTSIGVDALILQDLGVAKIVREVSPDMKMHASTQVSVQTLYGVEELKNLGFTRMVLPRELNRNEIENTVKNAGIETEIFVHGALCMCVSGQCQLSAFLGGRSGNRGRCAQPCRLPFSVQNGTGHDLSLKDLSLIEELPYLQNIGVSSFKIEGRMKRAEYVAGAVTACRESLEGAYSESRKRDLQNLFSRSGFTKGYFENKLGRDMFGTRTEEDKQMQSSVLDEYKRLGETVAKSRKVSFLFKAYEGEEPVLKAVCDGKEVAVSGETVCESARTLPLDPERVKEQLRKCGNTQFEAEKTEVEIGENVSVPISVINSLRRSALEKLESEFALIPERRIIEKTYKNTTYKSGETSLYLRFQSAEQIPESIRADKIILPLDTDEKTVEKYNAAVEIPRGIFGSADNVFDKLCKSKAKEAFCHTLDAVNMAKRAGKRVICSPFINAFNSLSLSELEKLGAVEVTVSNELSLKQISSLGGTVKRGVTVYGSLPLMLVRSCPLKNGRTCDKCDKKGFLTDRMGKRFPVRCTNGCSEIFNSVPLYLADKLSDVKNVDFGLLYFTVETAQEVANILDNYKKQNPPTGEFTRGLLYKGVE